MKRFWEKFDISFESGNLAAISIKSLRQLRPYRNIYNLELGAGQTNPVANTIIIIEKNLNTILAAFSVQAVLNGDYLEASEKYDTFPIERLEIKCVEITRFEIASVAWLQLGFRAVFLEFVSKVLEELDADAVILHHLECVANVHASKTELMSSPFVSEAIFCDRYQRSVSESNLNIELTKSTERSHISQDLVQLLSCGFEIWGEPIVYENQSVLSVMLGHLSHNGLSQVRPLSVVNRANLGGVRVTL